MVNTRLVRLWSMKVRVFSCLGFVMLASLSALSVSVLLRQILEWCEWLEITRSSRNHLLDDPILHGLLNLVYVKVSTPSTNRQ